MENNIDPTSYIDAMFNGAPTSLSRQEIKIRTGKAYTEKTLANLDNLGKGIPGRFYLGQKAMYPTTSTIAWLKSRVKAAPSESKEAC
jgi:hypothetical protein